MLGETLAPARSSEVSIEAPVIYDFSDEVEPDAFDGLMDKLISGGRVEIFKADEDDQERNQTQDVEELVIELQASGDVNRQDELLGQLIMLLHGSRVVEASDAGPDDDDENTFAAPTAEQQLFNGSTGEFVRDQKLDQEVSSESAGKPEPVVKRVTQMPEALNDPEVLRAQDYLLNQITVLRARIEAYQAIDELPEGVNYYNDGEGRSYIILGGLTGNAPRDREILNERGETARTIYIDLDDAARAMASVQPSERDQPYLIIHETLKRPDNNSDEPDHQIARSLTVDGFGPYMDTSDISFVPGPRVVDQTNPELAKHTQGRGRLMRPILNEPTVGHPASATEIEYLSDAIQRLQEEFDLDDKA